MKNLPSRTALVGLSLITWLPAKDVASTAVSAPAAIVVADQAPKDPALEAQTKEQEALVVENKLEAERLVRETNSMRAEVTRLKLERELITEKLALESAKTQVSLQADLLKLQAEKVRLNEQGELSKIKAEKLTNDLKAAQTEGALEITRLQSDIARIEATDKRSKFADSKPVYLQNPLRDDGILIISDRRIPLNGVITTDTADFVTSRIQYWNNKDRKLPIFLVIDASPGGSVMAGYRILKSMESSDAPIHVVVKSFAASMAAAITTLAQESYAYPNAVLLHHQISSTVFGQLNLTQQREFHEESERWWKRLGTPVAAKMGITPDEFIKQMYTRSSSGDWSEFGEQAAELKWVNHIVTGIDETSFNKDPDTLDPVTGVKKTAQAEEFDSVGKPFVWLPRLNPKDVYFIYNTDGYYRTR
jgi:ATP-dependent Clp protease protease subunit